MKWLECKPLLRFAKVLFFATAAPRDLRAAAYVKGFG
jgi:hypothetical protein